MEVYRTGLVYRRWADSDQRMTDTSRIPPRLLAARAVPAARRKLRCAASVLFVSFLALFTLVAAAGAQAPASLSSDFSGASLDPAVWQSPSPAGSAVLQSGKLRLVNGFLNTGLS